MNQPFLEFLSFHITQNLQNQLWCYLHLTVRKLMAQLSNKDIFSTPQESLKRLKIRGKIGTALFKKCKYLSIYDFALRMKENLLCRFPKVNSIEGENGPQNFKVGRYVLKLLNIFIDSCTYHPRWSSGLTFYFRPGFSELKSPYFLHRFQTLLSLFHHQATISLNHSNLTTE